MLEAKRLAKLGLQSIGLEDCGRAVLEWWRTRQSSARLAKQLAPLNSFANPFGVVAPKDREAYEKARELLVKDIAFQQAVARRTGFRVPEDFLNALALVTKVGLNVGINAPTADAGYVLYGVVRQYCRDMRSSVSVLEIGTSHGFSSTVMAKALRDSGQRGKIVTVDLLPVGRRIYWNTIRDLDGPHSVREALADFGTLIDDYIIYVQGFSDYVLRTLFMPRVHIAFVDGSHRESVVNDELGRIARMQQDGDVLIADDYVRHCPGVIRAVDSWVRSGYYRPKDLFMSDGSNGATLGMYVLQRTDQQFD